MFCRIVFSERWCFCMEINTSQRNKLDVVTELTELHVKLAKESGNPTLPEELEDLYLKYFYLVQYTPELLKKKLDEKN
jgi:hypothetical protein